MRPDMHVRVLGILMIAYALLMFGVGFALSFLRDVPGNIEALRAAAFVFALIPLAAGIGLLLQQRWGRIVAFVAAFVTLLSIPIGTALAIYAFIVLTRADVKAIITHEPAA